MLKRRHLEQAKRQITLIAVYIFLFTYLFPSGFAAAQVLFARPGPGVSNLPLNVFAFGDPGFGTVQEAINLANGNFFLSTNGMARNQDGDNNTDSSVAGEGWNLTPRLRLLDFNNTPQTSYTLVTGDGTNKLFQQANPSSLDYTKPTWISRYDSVYGTGAFLYHIGGNEAGVQFSQEWLVRIPNVNGNNLVHYYTHDGTRYTFYADGEYADFTQDLHQQYRSAVNNDPHGVAGSSPKTNFYYAGTPTSNPDRQGYLIRVKDEYGRVTKYTWSFPSKTLIAIYYLLNDENDLGSYARKVTFSYLTIGTQQYVKRITFFGSDGFGGEFNRWVEFTYYIDGLVEKIIRPVINDSNLRTYTHYFYDAQHRVTRIKQSADSNNATPTESDKVFNYSAVPEFAGGFNVLITQHFTREEYHFDENSLLRTKILRDYNYNAVTDVDRRWDYTYNAKGSIETIKDPYGKKDTYSYDSQGRLTRIQTSQNSGATYKEVFYTYDIDNNLHEVITPAISGTSPITYSYSQVKYTQPIAEFYTYTAPDGAVYQAKKRVRNHTIVGTTITNYQDDYYDNRGLLTQTVYVKNADSYSPSETVTTNYIYGNFDWSPFYPPADGTFLSTNVLPAARQYGDMVLQIDRVGLNTTILRYDNLGNLVYQEDQASLAKDIGNASNSAPEYGNRQIYKTFNGFGQQTWQLVRGQGMDSGWQDSERWIKSYYRTGEIDYSWEGRWENLTDYSYHGSGADLGRLIWIKKGIDTSAITATQKNVETVREFIQFTDYDDLGRPVAKSIDGFEFTYGYDSLDRLSMEARPDGGYTKYQYMIPTTAGDIFRDGVEINGIGWEYTNYDFLGRKVKVTFRDNQSISYTYDPYANLLEARDTRLSSINGTSSANQKSYYKYDSFGNLIAEMGPPMRQINGGIYQDSRRPFTKYSYDNSNRLALKKQQVNGPNSVTTNFNEPAGAEWAETEFEYDTFDRLIRIFDPLDYETLFLYDALGNKTLEQKQVWKATGHVAYPGYQWTFTHYAYDASGRVTKVRDPRGSIACTKFDPNNIGLVQYETQLKGVVAFDNSCATTNRYEYVYTADGLLTYVLEPSVSSPTATNMVYTKQYFYNSGSKYPAWSKVANQDTQANSAGAPVTFYVYNWAGRVTQTTLPQTSDGSSLYTPTIIQAYDLYGNQTYLKDANGFVTRYEYDLFNQLTKETKEKRSQNSVDNAALPNGHLITLYDYDDAGNLIRETRSPSESTGINTYYFYNSLGQVVAESPSKTSSGTIPVAEYKLNVYRLDGTLIGETSYDYQGSLRSGDTLTIANIKALNNSTNRPITSGNITTFTLDARGNRTDELSYGSFVLQSGGLTSLQTEYIITNSVDGLGQRYKRVFKGHYLLHPFQRYTSGTELGTNSAATNYNTYWTYDQNGNITHYWDTLADNITSNQGFNDTESRNKYAYTYFPSDKIQKETRVVHSKISNSQTALDGAVLAASTGTIEAWYNNRDLLYKSEVVDNSPQGGVKNLYGNQVTAVTNYNFYQSGQTKNVIKDGITSVYKYDTLGKIYTVYDPNGNAPTNSGGISTGIGPATTYTNYFADGKVKNSLRAGNENLNGTLLYTDTSIPTVGGLIYESYSKRIRTWTVTEGQLVQNHSATSEGKTNTVYNQFGLPVSIQSFSEEYSGWSGPTASCPTKSQDNYQITTLNLSNTLNYTSSQNVTNAQVNTTSRSGTIRQQHYDEGFSSSCQVVVQQDTDRTYTLSNNIIVNNTYSANGDLRQETFTPNTYTIPGNSQTQYFASNGYDTATTVTYELDSRGNRRTVYGGKYANFKKRYDANEQPVQFDKGKVTTSGWEKTGFLNFFYNPFGQQTISAESGLSQKVATPTEYRFERSTYVNYGFGNNVEFIRHREGQISNTTSTVCILVFCSSNTSSGNTWDGNQSIKDELFTLADGVSDETWAVQQAYEVRVTDVTYPLEAPSESVTTNIGINPLEVASPDIQGSPVDPSKVEKGQDESAEQATSSNGESADSTTLGTLSNPINLTSPNGLASSDTTDQPSDPSQDGINSNPTPDSTNNMVDITSLPSLNNPGTNYANNPGVPSSGENLPLEAPETALPEGLRDIDATAIAGNEAPGNPLPTNPTEIALPDEASPPTLGTSPSDGPLEFSPPETVEVTVPPVTGGAEPITEVTPPVGWEDFSNTETFGVPDGDTPCERATNAGLSQGAVKKFCSASSLNELEDMLKEARNATVGDDISSIAAYLAHLLVNYASEFDAANGTHLASDIAQINAATQYWNPEARLYFNLQLGHIFHSGANLSGGKAILTDYFDEVSTLAHTAQKEFLTFADIIANDNFDAFGESFRSMYGANSSLMASISMAGLGSGLLSRSNLSSNSPMLIGKLIADAGLIENYYGIEFNGITWDGYSEQIVGMSSGFDDAQGRLSFMLMGSRSLGKLSSAAYQRMGPCYNSFSYDTPVVTQNGLVPIGTLAVGELVFAYNEATEQVELQPITAFHENNDPVTINLTIDNDTTDDLPGLVLETTPEHPFYVSGTWVNAEDLTEGTVLTALDGNALVNLGIITGTERIEQEQVMYNLTVDVAHTFFVGEGEWLVHNSNCPIYAQNRPNFDILGSNIRALGQRYQSSGRNRFPDTANPNQVYYREDSNGQMTAYAVYDDSGRMLKRVDLSPNSAIHDGIAPPHVLEYDVHFNPLGQEFVSPGITRKIYPWEKP